MKFIRLNEYQPERSKEFVEALDYLSKIATLKKELIAALKQSGRVVTASINFLQIRIAQNSTDVIEKQKFVAQKIADELLKVRSMDYDSPEEKVEAVKKWYSSNGVQDAIWLQVNQYRDKKIRGLAESGIPLRDAEEIVDEAEAHVMSGKRASDGNYPIINTLINFDPSKGSLFNYVNGAIDAAIQSPKHKYFQRMKEEQSMNEQVGDDGSMEMGDYIQGQDDFSNIDINESNRVTKLEDAAEEYILNLTKSIANETNPGKLRINQLTLDSIQNPEGDFQVSLNKLRGMAQDIDTIEKSIGENNRIIQQINQYRNAPNADQNVLKESQKLYEKFTQQNRQKKAVLDETKNQFEEIFTRISNMGSYDADTGATYIEPEIPNATQGVTQDGMASTELDQSSQPIVKTKARGNRTLLSPADQKLINDDFERSRKQIAPYIYKGLGLPSGKPFKGGNQPNLFNIKEVANQIQDKKDWEALNSGNFEEATNVDDVIYADIFLRGLLYARDKRAIDKAYDPEIVTNESEILRNATDQFNLFMTESIKNHPILQKREAEFISQHGNDEEVMKHAPIEKLLQKLVAFTKNEMTGKGEKATAPDNKFRTTYEHFDRMARAGAYLAAKEELFGEKPWNELTPEDKQQIANLVYKNQYGGGKRPMYIGRDRPGAEKHKARYPASFDLDGSRYIPWMNNELDNISSNPNNTDWHAKSSNDEDFKNKGKVKNQPQMSPDEIVQACGIRSLIRIANILDEMGQFKIADSVTGLINGRV